MESMELVTWSRRWRKQ